MRTFASPLKNKATLTKSSGEMAAETKFFSSRVTFEIENSITERQVKSAFSSAAQMMGFINMIFNEVDKSFTVKLDGLIMQTINNMTAETLHDAMPTDDYTAVGNARAVNLCRQTRMPVSRLESCRA